MVGIIYKITNLANGKVYIGQSIRSLSRRRNDHLSRLRRGNRDHKIYAAFRKYGVDNFKWEVIDKCQDLATLNLLEQKYIELHDSYRRGYNMNPGGFSVGEATRKKLSKIFKGREISWKDKSVETFKRNYRRENHPAFGKRGLKCKTSKRYVITTPDGFEFCVKGLRKWCDDFNAANPGIRLTHTNFVFCAKGQQGSYKGFKCRYADDSQASKHKFVKKERGKRFTVTSPDGEKHKVVNLAEWCRNAKGYSLFPNSLILCAQGKKTSYKGFTCEYADDQRSTTIPKGSTPQAIGGGNGGGPSSRVVI